jgi:hypothetical protein
MRRGEHGPAGRILERALAVSRDASQRNTMPFDWNDVLVEIEVLALQGRKDEALAALRRMIDAGWRWEPWQVAHDPTLANIRDDPAFAAMLAEVEAKVAADLERVRALERDGRIHGLPPER